MILAASKMHGQSSMGKPYDIQERSFAFACDVLDFCWPLVVGHPLVVSLRVSCSKLIAILTTIRKNSESNDDRGS